MLPPMAEVWSWHEELAAMWPTHYYVAAIIHHDPSSRAGLLHNFESMGQGHFWAKHWR
jgi:hypothetical protein